MAEGVLGQIAAAKREELARRFDTVSLDALRSRAEPTRRSLAAALAQDGARFILEIKKASPSAGAIRPGADPAQLAMTGSLTVLYNLSILLAVIVGRKRKREAAAEESALAQGGS